MPRACCLLRISGDCQSPLLSLSLSIELLCRSRKKHIAATVEGGFDGVLDDTDDEADSDRLVCLFCRLVIGSSSFISPEFHSGTIRRLLSGMSFRSSNLAAFLPPLASRTCTIEHKKCFSLAHVRIIL